MIAKKNTLKLAQESFKSQEEAVKYADEWLEKGYFCCFQPVFSKKPYKVMIFQVKPYLSIM